VIAIDPVAFHSALDGIFGFVGFEPVQQTTRSLSVQDARNALRRKGWTQVQAAQALGVTPIHLSYVLNGRRESRRIIREIQLLPENPTPA
jgi:CRP-like cAMP-binding protein